MGNNRRPRQQSGHQHSYHWSRSRSHSGSPLWDQKEQPQTKEVWELTAALQEVEGGGRDFLAIFAYLSGLAVLAMVMGLVAGMAISVHYFEMSRMVVGTKLSLDDAEFLYNGPSAQRRVTSLDASIAASNVVQKWRNKNDVSLELGKVITTTESGQLHVLMVVEEVEAVHQEQGALDGGQNSTRVGDTDAPGGSESSLNFPELSQPTILPYPCKSDGGKTFGFDNWERLRAAIMEANALSAEKFMKWQQWFATNSFTAFDDNRMYYEEDIIFTVCPRINLKVTGGAIFVNAENIRLECEGCIIYGSGTHFDFGGYAKNVLVRGLTFKKASTSSLTLFNDGAVVSFEDCTWVDNTGSTDKLGSVADVNSTSIIDFFRCEISVNGDAYAATTSSLSIRA